MLHRHQLPSFAWKCDLKVARKHSGRIWRLNFNISFIVYKNLVDLEHVVLFISRLSLNIKWVAYSRKAFRPALELQPR